MRTLNKGGSVMKRFFLLGIFLSVLLIFPAGVMAADNLAEADALFEKGGVDNHKMGMELCLKAVAENPDSFEANWKCARAHRWYCEESKRQQVEGWEDICKVYAKKGMGYADKAIELDPNAPEGYFWYGTNVGNYSDGVSILTALKEGLKNKTQESFETVYEIDKMYDNAGAVLALGRFWSVLPWPLKNLDKALTYFEEFEQYFPERDDFQVYYAEALIDKGGKANKAKAAVLIDQALKSDKKWFSDWASRLKKDL
jgi:tetratricopeptide (TPR) repeat protein